MLPILMEYSNTLLALSKYKCLAAKQGIYRSVMKMTSKRGMRSPKKRKSVLLICVFF